MTRRWTSEAQVLEEMERLNDLSMDKARDFAGLAVEAATAEAAHKTLRAKRILAAQAGGVKSISGAEAVADADDAVGQALLERLVSNAHAEACREALRSIRTNQDGLRTAAASHRTPFSGPGMQ